MKKKVIVCAMILGASWLNSSMNAVAAPVCSPELVTLSSSSESDWDSILDSYEKFVNQYIAVYKKVQAGDMSAYSSMVSLMVKYQKLANQLEKAQDEMSESQVARYAKITAKLASAIQ